MPNRETHGVLVFLISMMNLCHGMADTQVMVAIRSKSAEDVRIALTEDVDVNLRHEDCSNHTLLSEAVGSGDAQKVALLLQDPTIQLDTPLERNWTVLHIATHTKLAEITGMLVARGANIRAVNKDGRTPLHEAMYTGCSKTALTLLTQIPHKKIKQLTYFNQLVICRTLEMCFFRFKNEGLDIPKDIRKMLCEYTLRGYCEPLMSLVKEQVENLKPIIIHKDISGRTPFEIVMGKECSCTFAFLYSQIQEQKYHNLEDCIFQQLRQDLNTLNSTSTPHSSSIVQNQSTQSTE